MFRINSEATARIDKVHESKTNIFSDLSRIAGLNPREDFKYANLQDVDFTGSDLSEFDFSYADLRGARWDLNSNPSEFRYSLRGRRRDNISASEYLQLRECVKSNKTWGERFFIFVVTVDNFGETSETLEILDLVINSDSSKYMRYSAYLYYIGSYLGNRESMNYCLRMANAGSAYNNMFRFKKLLRLLSEVDRYARQIANELRGGYPGRARIVDILELGNKLRQ